jgi:hypothetical protein
MENLLFVLVLPPAACCLPTAPAACRLLLPSAPAVCRLHVFGGPPSPEADKSAF